MAWISCEKSCHELTCVYVINLNTVLMLVQNADQRIVYVLDPGKTVRAEVEQQF